MIKYVNVLDANYMYLNDTNTSNSNKYTTLNECDVVCCCRLSLHAGCIDEVFRAANMLSADHWNVGIDFVYVYLQ